MSINISDADAFPEVLGALVLGRHSLHFARGSSVDDLPGRPERRYEFAGFQCVYQVDGDCTQSFLAIDGLEVSLTDAREDTVFELHWGAFLEGVPAELVCDPGLIALIAPTRWGKSTVLHGGVLASMRDEDPVVINYLEVFEKNFGFTPVYIAREKRLLSYLLLALMTPRSVVAIDSLRAFVYGRSVGGTGTAGLDQYLSIQLTALANVMAPVGSLAIVTINPELSYEKEKDRERYDEIAQKLVASTTLAFVATDSRRASIYPRGLSQNSRERYDVIVKELRDTAASAPTPATPVVAQTVVISPTKRDDAQLLTARRLLVTQAQISNEEKEV